MSLLEIKTALALCVLLIGVLGALLPWGLRARTPQERILARGDTFAGGVLGGAGLLHLLAGGIEGFRTLAPDLDYPLALLLAGVGFLLILLIEGVIVGERSVIGHSHESSRYAVSHELGSGASPVAERGAYAYVLLLVLSVHSVIVGLALGAQESLSAALIIFVAIVAHKGVAGFALGISYARGGASWREAAPGVVFFAAMTPLGILSGSAAGALLSTQAARIFQSTFDAIGAGTFLYIAALDIIRTEFSSPEDRWGKWLWTCLGFAVMALLAVWV